LKPFTVIILTFIVTGIVVFLWCKRSNWKLYVDEKHAALKKSSLKIVRYVNLEAETKKLPYCVKKYFHLVLKDRIPVINRALVTQSGGFRAKPEMKDWSKMEAEQIFSTNSRAFIWNSKITIVPCFSINICDSYINGKAGMKGNILSFLTLIDEKNKKEIDKGALQRYLAESVWFPTALLPSQGVVWREIDDFRAEAEIADAGITVSLEFEFNEKGEVISVYSPKRYREVSGKYEPTPWKGIFSKYMDASGYLIPIEAEGAWHLEDQVYSYWKASIVNVVYE
jgi:hypothetical protein